MKRLVYLLIPALFFASCGGKKEEKTDAKTEATPVPAKKVTPVAVTEVQPIDFTAYVEVQAQVTSDENVVASPRAAGTVTSVLVQAGQHVGKGQVLAAIDASTVVRQIEAMQPQLELTKSLYEKQQNLWKQEIGTEVQLMTAKANYESVQKQIEALKTQKDMFRVISPITGVVDAVSMKVGDVAAPGQSGIRVVNYDKLKAEANLGENYLGKVKQGDVVLLVLPDVNDTVKAHLSYVAQAIDPASRTFAVQVRLANSTKMHPNMACLMKIANYESKNALVVPVAVIQKTSQGDMLYVADGNKAKSVMVTTGRNSNGMVEILSGLNAGDRVVTHGFEELDNGQQITIH